MKFKSVLSCLGFVLSALAIFTSLQSCSDKKKKQDVERFTSDSTKIAVDELRKMADQMESTVMLFEAARQE